MGLERKQMQGERRMGRTGIEMLWRVFLCNRNLLISQRPQRRRLHNQRPRPLLPEFDPTKKGKRKNPSQKPRNHLKTKANKSPEWRIVEHIALLVSSLCCCKAPSRNYDIWD